VRNRKNGMKEKKENFVWREKSREKKLRKNSKKKKRESNVWRREKKKERKGVMKLPNILNYCIQNVLKYFLFCNIVMY